MGELALMGGFGIALVIWASGGLVIGFIAEAMGRIGILWALVAFLISPLLAAIVLLIIGRVQRPIVDVNAPTEKTHVLCPECLEPVKNEAKVCRYCRCKLIPLSLQPQCDSD